MKRLLLAILILGIVVVTADGQRGRYDGPGIHSGALLIAASDSSAIDKANAWKECDGTADQVEIQAAIDSLSLGGTVFLAAGNYVIPADIVMAADVVLAGTWASKLTSPAGSDDSIITGTSVDGFVIRGLYLEGTTASNTLAAHIGLVRLNNCDNATVEGCYVTGSDAGGIVATESDKLKLFFNTITENADDGIELFDGCDNGTVTGNVVFDNSPDGNPSPSGNFKVRNNCFGLSVTGNSFSTQYVNNVIFFTSGSADPAASANGYTGNDTSTVHATGHAMQIQGTATGDDVRFWNIAGNPISSLGGSGIQLQSWVRGITISGNTVIAKVGLNCGNSTFEKINLTGNTFLVYPGSGGTIGMVCNGTWNSSKISNNLFDGYATTGLLLAANNILTNCSITGNTVTGGTALTRILTLYRFRGVIRL